MSLKSLVKVSVLGLVLSALAQSAAQAQSTGNPFIYTSGSDQFLACYGIAGPFSSNCDGISDFNDQQMCYAMSRRVQAPCSQMTDRNLQLACYGMVTQTWTSTIPSNCDDITQVNLRNFCYAVSTPSTLPCNSLAGNTQLLCFAMSTGNPVFCNSINNSNDRAFCYGVSSHNNSYCASIIQ